MTAPNIPFHNPENVPTDKLQPGERFATVEEVMPDSPLKGKACAWESGKWGKSFDYWCNISRATYKTREPLPPQYRSQYVPIPSDLPSLLVPFDSTTHFPKYEGKAWESNGPVLYACMREGNDDWSVGSGWNYPEATTGLDNFHYVQFLAIDYADPAYRAYVEDAFNKGATIEHRGKVCGPDWRIPPDGLVRGFIWNHNDYRVAQPAASPAEEVEPAYNSREHKLEVLAAALDGKEVQARGNKCPWTDEPTLSHIADAIQGGLEVRIKPKAPPAPVFSPLTDIKLSEVVKKQGDIVYAVTGFDSMSVHLESVGGALIEKLTPRELMDGGWLIHRNGSWQPCSKQVERKG